MSASVVEDGIIIKIGALTDVGRRRQGNEDSFLVADLSSGKLGLLPEVCTHQIGSNGTLLIVSDGLGGAAAGEVASSMAVQTICTELMKYVRSNLPPSDRLKRSTELANQKIWESAQSDRSLQGMGATVTAAYVYGHTVYIAQVGDSRAYIIRNGRVKQVTEDQSWANAIKKAGLEATHVPSNVILQALGTQPKVHVEVTSVELIANDILLLCSDGLSNKVKDDEICSIVSKVTNPELACKQLVDLANERGGEDNITVVIATFFSDKLKFEENKPSITSSFKVVSPLFPDGMDDESIDDEEIAATPKGESVISDTRTSDLPVGDFPIFSELPQTSAPTSLPKPASNLSSSRTAQAAFSGPSSTPSNPSPQSPPKPPADLFGIPPKLSPPPTMRPATPQPSTVPPPPTATPLSQQKSDKPSS
ncbi:MAG: protein phosphatase 2C domain-containing protein, partial [Acidobacteriota bacterium]|nr:protein phosphatase 2C domain-containing protein [Acidobacteriota bacterium]